MPPTSHLKTFEIFLFSKNYLVTLLYQALEIHTTCLILNTPMTYLMLLLIWPLTLRPH